jgi:hypothetical protein
MPKELVEKWIEKGCNYEDGCTLFAQYGKNKVLARIFPGRQHRYEGKLKYELCKAVHISDSLDQTNLHSQNDLPENKANSNLPVNKLPAIQVEDDLPEEVKMVTTELSRLTAERAKLHELMSKIEGNEETSVDARKQASDKIESLSNLIEILYSVKEAYYNDKVIPNIAELFAEPISAPEKPDNELPNTIDELKELKKSIQRSLSKDKNLLEFQTETKQKKANPMSESPKRKGIEKRIDKKIKKIESIDFKLIDLAN